MSGWHWQKTSSYGVIDKILEFLLEGADSDEDFKEVAGINAVPEVELSLSEIKSKCSEFFSRENTRIFGTRAVYKYPGNYVVLKNVRRRAARHGFPSYSTTDFVIYKFKSGGDFGDGDLIWVAEAKNLPDAKMKIKTRNFEYEP